MARKQNLVVDQGSTFSQIVTLYDQSNNAFILTSNTFVGNAQIRKHYSSSNNFYFNVTQIANTGNLVLSLNSAYSNTITSGRYVYDVEMTSISNNAIYRVLEGVVTVTPNVTR